jgi:hypothetical protein
MSPLPGPPLEPAVREFLPYMPMLLARTEDLPIAHTNLALLFNQMQAALEPDDAKLFQITGCDRLRSDLQRATRGKAAR